MRIQAFTLLVLASLLTSVSANDEIKRLVADLSFGDAMMADSPTSDSVPVPTTLLTAKPQDIENVVPVVDFSELPALSGLVAKGPNLSPPPESASKAVLKNPVPNAVSPTNVGMVDGSTSSPPKVVMVHPVENKSVGHHHHRQASEPRGYETVVVCRPRIASNLPTSTFLQYFRGSPCYSNVWDGYRYECGTPHTHLHGECDCFKGKSSGCESCDSRKPR